MRYLHQYKIILAGIGVVGAILGYAYYHYVGCNGQCMIASSPWRSTVYGMVMGALVANMFRKPGAKTDSDSQPPQ